MIPFFFYVNLLCIYRGFGFVTMDSMESCNKAVNPIFHPFDALSLLPQNAQTLPISFMLTLCHSLSFLSLKVDALNGMDIDGRPIVVQIATPAGSRPARAHAPRPDDNERKVYVGNIDFQTTDGKKSLQQMFRVI